MCGECWAEGTQEGRREGWRRAAGGGAREAFCLPRALATHPLPGGRGLERRSLTVVAEAAEVPRGPGGLPEPGRPLHPCHLGSDSDLPLGGLSLPRDPACVSISHGHCPESGIWRSGPLTGPHSSAPWPAPTWPWKALLHTDICDSEVSWESYCTFVEEKNRSLR